MTFQMKMNLEMSIYHNLVLRNWFLVLFLKKFFNRRPSPTLSGFSNITPLRKLNLRSGELVRVKNKDEIRVTLDKMGKNRGLAFTPEMVRYCGSTYLVIRRVKNLIDEATGVRHEIFGTVILENVRCDGTYHSKCPRGCYLLWREIWLERAGSARSLWHTVT